MVSRLATQASALAGTLSFEDLLRIAKWLLRDEVRAFPRRREREQALAAIAAELRWLGALEPFRERYASDIKSLAVAGIPDDVQSKREGASALRRVQQREGVCDGHRFLLQERQSFEGGVWVSDGPIATYRLGPWALAPLEAAERERLVTNALHAIPSPLIEEILNTPR